VPGLSLGTGRLGRRLRNDRDRGAVAALVAILLSSGVLLGMTAFSIDLGTMYGERAQLISGANAAALTVAENCARPGQVCGSAFGQNVARSNANRNALDNAMTVDSICGRDLVSGRLGACSPPAGAGTHCVGTPPVGVSYAEVYTSTLTPDGSFVLPPVFAGAVVAGYRGAHIQACSRVAWGTPAGPYSALTVSQCQFTNLTTPAATRFPPSFPSRPANAAAIEVAINMATPQSSGQACGGSLGVLNGGGCEVTNLTYGSNGTGQLNRNGTGNISPTCQNVMSNNYFPPQSDDLRPYLLMPIYSTINPLGNSGNARFQNFVGVAAFQVTGYKFDNGPGTDAGGRDWLGVSVSAGNYCGPGTNGQSRCIRGYFVSATILDGTWPATGWPQTYGASVFRTAG
jgi:Flp pilus assembly protein TadG